jgi:hypothetical protein
VLSNVDADGRDCRELGKFTPAPRVVVVDGIKYQHLKRHPDLSVITAVSA